MIDSYVFLMSDVSSRGFAIAIAGMLIVASALTVISLFIAGLPKILAVISKVWPENEGRHASHSQHERLGPYDEALYAAIGYALHLKNQKR